MIEWYLASLKAHPLLSSAIQVAILGMLGELLAVRVRSGKWHFFDGKSFVMKLVVWAFLGITFKYAFTGFFGFVDAIIVKGFWFSIAGESVFWKALSTSVFTNLLFGPMMMLFHRWTDNHIEKKEMNWRSLQKAWFTLIWFWIPAHTITFSLPSHLQVGLAALWALALGVILGYFARARK